MTEATPADPYKEEDEGYLAAEAGQRVSDNPYPRRTIRHEQWKRGWQAKHDETLRAIRLGRKDGP